MKILITGGNGFLGKRLGKALKSKGHEVILASRNNKQNLIVIQITDYLLCIRDKEAKEIEV